MSGSVGSLMRGRAARQKGLTCLFKVLECHGQGLCFSSHSLKETLRDFEPGKEPNKVSLKNRHWLGMESYCG